MRRLFPFFILLMALLFGTPGCSNIKEASKEFFAMSTFMTIQVSGQDPESALEEAEGIIRNLEAHLSVTDPVSDLYAINKNGGEPVEVSDETAALISFALEMADATDGALDPTIYPVARAWGFTTEEYRLPSDDEIASLLKNTGYEKASVSGNVVMLEPGMEIDLGAVAKGYTGDVLATFFQDKGINSALINLGGNVQAVGSKPDGTPWTVGIRTPEIGSSDIFGVLSVSDCAVVTSGSYEKYFEKGDKIYGHIIDPKTGHPVDGDLASVTVVGPEGAVCDALSTALFVMGKEKAAQYWRDNNGFDMLLVTTDGEILLTEGIQDTFSLRDGQSYSVSILEKNPA